MLPQLILVVGLPGTGKTTLARGIAERLGATFVRIDAVETAIQVARGDHSQVGAEGYFVAHFLARSNLELGRDVVVDAVCPVPASRSGWSETAGSTKRPRSTTPTASQFALQTRAAASPRKT